MLLRGRSKDRNENVTPPGPSYMSNEQFASYLADLRNNRIARPSGARPPPVSTRPSYRETDSMAIDRSQTPGPAEPTRKEMPPRAISAMSNRRNQSSMSNYSTSSRVGRPVIQQPHPGVTSRDFSTQGRTTPLKPSEVVPSATYIERGLRWMEKEEAVSLRDAMEDMEIQKREKEEARIHTAAQEEASELVYQHQHQHQYPEPNRPDGNYRDHLRRNSYAHARTASVGKYPGMGTVTGLARDTMSRTVSGSSLESAGQQSDRSRVSSGSSNESRASKTDPKETQHQGIADVTATASNVALKSYPKSLPEKGVRRRSNGKRNISGEIAAPFTGDQIWEEPDEVVSTNVTAAKIDDTVAPLKLKAKNPINRVSFTESSAVSRSASPEVSKGLSKYEIHRNPPSQSRDPIYTINTNSPSDAVANISISKPTGESPGSLIDGKEVRSDEIRKATSMLLKDRSPKLPTPTAVTSRSSRPIVSFDANWKAKEEADLKSDEQIPRVKSNYVPKTPFGARQGAKSLGPTSTQSLPSTPALSCNVPAPESKASPHIPSIQISASPSNFCLSNTPISTPSIPTISISDTSPSIPSINISGPSIPTINIPTINLPSQISVSTPPKISGSDTSYNKTDSGSTRPPPHPRISATRPLPSHHSSAPTPIPRGGHWSPAPSNNRATATCHACSQTITGRYVSLRGVSERFHPHCFICHTCGTSLEALEISPEPSDKRAARLARIRRRAAAGDINNNDDNNNNNNNVNVNNNEAAAAEPAEAEIDGETAADDGDERLRFYCHLDWHEQFAPRCRHCTTPIVGEHAVALGAHWHWGHFFCAECGDPFAQGATHIEKDGYAWCLPCQTRRTERRAPRCKRCKGPVVGEYVVAVGGEWHAGCFRCAECGGGFEDGKIFPRLAGEGAETVACCVRCMEREWKA